jgi:hypothetical protein
MSAISLVVPENKIYVDGETVTVDDLGLDDNVWAIQWNGSKGDIEYNDGTPNKAITADDFDEAAWVAKYKQAQLDEEAAIAAAEKKEADAMTYKDKRREEYDQLEQFELMYDDKINDTTTWVDAVQAIKKSIPKE